MIETVGGGGGGNDRGDIWGEGGGGRPRREIGVGGEHER